MSEGPHGLLIARAWRRSRLVVAVHGTVPGLRPVLAGLLVAAVVAAGSMAPDLADRLHQAHASSAPGAARAVSRGR